MEYYNNSLIHMEVCIYCKNIPTYINIILYKYIEHNFMVQAIWSPNIVILEKKTNRKLLREKRLELVERLITCKKYQKIIILF